MSAPTGGTAFPAQMPAQAVNEHGQQQMMFMPGMSLLDYFAAHVLGACAVSTSASLEMASDLAEFAYDAAVAMIKERERRMRAEGEGDV